MKLIRIVLVTVVTLITAIVGGVVASVVYRRLRYPHVPIEETDVFFDIGLVFFLGFAAVIAVALVASILYFRKRRAITVTPRGGCG
jgi:H+/Cl- antiporter ClcA